MMAFLRRFVHGPAPATERHGVSGPGASGLDIAGPSRELKSMNSGRDDPAVSAYIAAFPPGIRAVLERIRRSARAAAPSAEELLSYRMPALRQGRILIYFAAFKAHIGVFPPVSGVPALEKALAPYAGPKGNLRFPLDRPIPYGLIRRIVRHRVRRNAAPDDGPGAAPSRPGRTSAGASRERAKSPKGRPRNREKV